MADAGALAALPPRFEAWFAARGWRPRAHQLEMVEKGRAGRDVLLIAPTGGGKTLAGFLPSLIELSERPPANAHPGLHTLYISPLKALAVDVERNLQAPLVGIAQMAQREGGAFHMPAVAIRTGDTPANERARFARTRCTDPPHAPVGVSMSVYHSSDAGPYLRGIVVR